MGASFTSEADKECLQLTVTYGNKFINVYPYPLKYLLMPFHSL